MGVNEETHGSLVVGAEKGCKKENSEKKKKHSMDNQGPILSN